jgi:hypothetical protein
MYQRYMREFMYVLENPPTHPSPHTHTHKQTNIFNRLHEKFISLIAYPSPHTPTNTFNRFEP